jgi:hypothetical protein
MRDEENVYSDMSGSGYSAGCSMESRGPSDSNSHINVSGGVAQIQRFNGNMLDWPVWGRHFRPIAEVQEWDDHLKVVQLVSYLDDLPMNVVQELSDLDLYDYDVLVQTLDKRSDPASRVSSYR